MIGRLFRWVYSRWRARRARGKVRDVLGGLQGKLGCEACQERPAEHEVPSAIEDRVVLLCDWCYRRFRRLNERRDIPKTRRRKT